MIQTVLKRDGRVVGFNEEKIVAAVRRAMLHTDKGEDMQLAHEIADRIACRGQEQMSVEDIQNCVEIELMKSRVKMWLNYILLTGISVVWPVKRKPGISFWKS